MCLPAGFFPKGGYIPAIAIWRKKNTHVASEEYYDIATGIVASVFNSEVVVERINK